MQRGVGLLLAGVLLLSLTGDGGLSPPTPDESWLARTKRDLAEFEYHASVGKRGLQAPNRAQGLRTYFEPTGIRLHDRLKTDGSALASVTLSGVGRGATLAPVKEGVVYHDGARVEIRRDDLVEWYVNAPNGLEQGFTFARRVSGEGELVLELTLAGAKAALVAGGALELESSSGRGLRYDQLVAEDARGRQLPARIELARADRVRLVVDDRDAAYPVVVDPFFTATFDARLTAGQSGSLFGLYLSSAGDVNRDGYADVIVGAPQYDSGQPNEGAAFIFHGGPTGLPTGGIALAATTLQSDQGSAEFGREVASAGDLNGDGYGDVIVGAYGYIPVVNPGIPGAALIFLGGPSGIANGGPTTASTILDARPVSGTASADAFGYNVAGAGDVNQDGFDDVLVSASNTGATPASADGAVFLYLGSASGIASGGQAEAAATLTGGSDWGAGADIAGACDVNADGYDDVIVGAPYYPGGSLEEPGLATVHLGSPTGFASGRVDLVASTVLAGSGPIGLGSGIACAGDVNGDAFDDLAVLASWPGSPFGYGEAYFYLGSASGIPAGSEATANGTLFNVANQLATPIAPVGDVNGDGFADLLVSQDSLRVQLYLGAAEPFVSGTEMFRVGVEGSPSMSPAGAGDVNGDGFDDILVGAPNYLGSGAVYLFQGTAQPWPPGDLFDPPNRMELGFEEALLGFSVASAGDVNGDGYDDRVIGAPKLDFGEPDEGGAWIFLGSPTPNAVDNYGTVHAQLQSDQSGSQFGASVSSAGDVNGDGYADVIVGASGWSSPETLEGAAFIFQGSPFGLFVSPAGRIESNQDNAALGRSVAGAGDVNGDGYADVIVSANLWSGATSTSAALLFHGGRAGIGERISETASGRIDTGQPDAAVFVAGPAGDVNSDGFGDVLVSSTGYSDPELLEGGVFIFHGASSGIGNRTFASANSKLESNVPFGAFGRAAAAAGDVNGDGYGDVITGWPNQSEPAAHVFLGGPTGIPSASPAAHEISSEDAPGFGSNWFSDSVAGVGDLNGDGFGDLVIGDWGYFSDRGAAFLVHGNVLASFPGPFHRLGGLQLGAQLGKSVAGGGDSNGDGYADVLIGSPYFDGVSVDQGEAYVFYGNGKGRPATRRQFARNSDVELVVPGGTTETQTSVRIEFGGNHPGGKGRMRSETQMCAVGTAFGAPGCLTQLSPWLAVTANLPTRFIFLNFTGLAANTRYRWRARIQYAEDSGPLPIAAHHGPWKRPLTPLAGFDVRTARDSDGDGITDMADNCPYVANPGQEDDGSLTFPDGVGNVCQCGNVAGDGYIRLDDVAAIRAALANPSGAGLSAAAQSRCVVFRAPGPCSVLQVSVLQRALATPTPLLPITWTPPAQVCPASQPAI